MLFPRQGHGVASWMPAEADEPRSSNRNESGERAQDQLLEVERGRRRWGRLEHQAVALAPRDQHEREPLPSLRAEGRELATLRQGRSSLRRCPDATK